MTTANPIRNGIEPITSSAAIMIPHNPIVAGFDTTTLGVSRGGFYAWLNAKRRHSTIGYLSPMEFERRAGFA